MIVNEYRCVKCEYVKTTFRVDDYLSDQAIKHMYKSYCKFCDRITDTFVGPFIREV